jgi:hypothetical protein
VTEVEVAYDSFDIDPQEKWWALLNSLSKHRHQRAYVWVCGYPCGTIYFEDRTSTVALKAYVRSRKLPNGKYGDEHLRIEFTLKRKEVIGRHLGGNTLSDLLKADLVGFRDRNLRLEIIDHDQLARVLKIKPRVEWANRLKIRRLAYETGTPFINNSLVSPATIRGVLKAAGYSPHYINKCFTVV